LGTKNVAVWQHQHLLTLGVAFTIVLLVVLLYKFYI
jgi:hypothetical protein